MATRSPAIGLVGHSRQRGVTAAFFFVVFTLYALTMARSMWHTDVFGANWTSWHIATTGSPWIDGTRIPEVGNRSDYLLAITPTANGHTAFGRFPGVVAASLPAYLVFGQENMSIIPGSLTAAFLSACSVALVFSALRRHLTQRQALVSAIVFGFATPMWTISANLLWPHTITVLGIAGMAWAASSGRWWAAGVFGGIGLWGRVHAALIVAVLGLGVALRRRQLGPLVKSGVASAVFLLGSCAWNRWMYGSWSPLAGYGESNVTASAGAYSTSLSNQLGMWISPDRGILVWTPIVALLLPALARSWGTLPDWSRSLAVGGLMYTLLQAAMITFTGGDSFYGYRYGLEFLACATPALALSQDRMGRTARVLAGPVVALQLFAFLLGAVVDSLYVPRSEVWHRNAFVHGLDIMGSAGWVLAGLVTVGGLLLALRAVNRTVYDDVLSDTQRVADPMSS